MNGSSPLLAAIAALLATALGQPTSAPSSADFRSIELRGGGGVTLVHGPDRRVTVIEGGAERPILSDGERLVIDRCRRPCAGGHRVKIEIVAPEIARLAVSDGGLIQVQGAFLPQAALTVAVDNGGVVDARALEPARVDAGVAQGGRIFVHPGRELDVTISNGGGVTYWGSPRVTSSVRHGGAVAPGVPADLRRPIDGFQPPLAPLRPLTSVRPH